MYYLQESQGIGPLEQFPNAKFAYHFSYQKVAMVIKEWKLFIQDGLQWASFPLAQKNFTTPISLFTYKRVKIFQARGYETPRRPS